MRTQRNWKKLVTLTSVVAVSLSVIAGCGGGAKKEPEKNAAEQTQTPVVITVMLELANPEAPKTDFLKKLEELSNSKIEINWVPKGGYAQKLSATFASGELPKALLVVDPHNANLVNGVRSGGFWEIGPYLKDYPNLSKLNPVVLNNTSIDGKTYGVYRARTLARGGIMFRKDWLDNLGLKTPTNMDEVYNVLKAFTNNDPDKNGKNDTIGSTGNVTGMLNDMMMYFGAPNAWEVKDGKFTPDFMTKEFMDTLKFMKKLYDEKIINQDFAAPSMKADDYILQGKAGAQFSVIDNAVNKFADVNKLNPKAELDVTNRIKGPKGERLEAGSGHNGVFVFPKSSVKTEAELKRILGVFDKLAGKEAQDLYVWGIEGVHYKMENGKPVRTDQTLFANDVNPYTQFKTSDSDLATEGTQTPIAAKVKKLQTEGAAIAVANPAEALISQTQTERGADLKKNIDDAKTKFVMGVIDEAGFNKEVDKWVKGGGDKIMAEYAAEYAKIKK